MDFYLHMALCGYQRVYGPHFMRFKSSGRTSKFLYRRNDVESWMVDMTCDPKGGAYD